MSGTDDTANRFAPIRVLPGYDHPSLIPAFNDLARTPYGRDVLHFCRDEKKTILSVAEHLRENILGEATQHEITVLEGAVSTTLAHEMRHVQQYYAMEGDDTIYNPMFSHMKNRIVEADAFTFACLHQISLWRENGFRNIGDIERNEPNQPDTENRHTCLLAFNLASVCQFSPAFMPYLLRKIFERYYINIALSESAPGYHCYEDVAVKHAQRVYRIMDEKLNPLFLERAAKTGISGLLATTGLCSAVAGFWEISAFSLAGLSLKFVYDKNEQKQVSKIVEDFNRSATGLIDNLVEKIGPIQGIEENYLTRPGDIKISDPFFTDLMLENRRAVHDTWRARLAPGIERHLKR